ncbi:MAG: hypothetical protein HKM02_09165, partial [Pseudomonadales bacterium]|nr:hypothetical protein [Pseudomonadales bacterium]
MTGSRVSRCLHVLWHYLTQAGLILLILAALYAGLGRQFMRVLLLHPDRLESFLSLQMGFRVHIGSAEGGWRGVEPTLRLSQVALALPGEQPFLVLPELILRPELGASVWHREARFALILMHVHLHMHQDAEGHWSIDELAKIPESDRESRKAMIRLLGHQPRLELDDTHLDIFSRQGKILQVTGLRIQVAGRGQLHTLLADGEMKQNGHGLGTLHVAVNMLGEFSQWDHAKIHAYLQIPKLSLENFLPDSFLGWKVGIVRGAWQFWGDQTPEKGRQVTLLAQGMHLEARDNERVLDFIWPQALMSWQGTGDNYRFTVQNVQAMLNHHPVQIGPVALQHRDTQWRIATGAFDLAMLNMVAQSILAPSNPLREAMTSLHLQGKFIHGILDFQQSGTGIQAQYVDAVINDAGWQPWQHVPGISHLDMDFRGTNQSGVVSLYRKNTDLLAPQYFDDPIKLNDLSAQGSWSRGSDGVLSVHMDDLQASNEDARIHAVLNLRVETTPHLSLMASMEQGQAASTWRYTPRRVVGDPTVSWLHAALKAGQVVRGDALYEGQVGDANNALQLHFNLQHVLLDYQPGWPSMKEVDALLSLNQGQWHLDQGQAQIWDTTLTEVHADLDSRSALKTLVLSGGVQGPATDILQLFRESPLADTLGKAVSGWTLTGPVKGQLNLELPLDSRPNHVDVQAILPGNDLSIRKPSMAFSHMHGQLHYESIAGLSGSLQSQFMQHPADVSVSSRMSYGQLQTLQVDAQGEANLEALATRWPGFWWTMLSGDVPFMVKLAIHPASHQTDTLELNSSLHGMQSQLPPPLDKSAAQDVPIILVAGHGVTDTLAHLRIGSRLGATMVFKQGQLQRAEIQLGSANQGWPTLPGIE